MNFYDKLLKMEVILECMKYCFRAYKKCKNVLSKIDGLNEKNDLSNLTRERRREIEKQINISNKKILKGISKSKFEDATKYYHNLYSSFSNKNVSITCDDEFFLLMETCNIVLSNYDEEEASKVSEILIELVRQKIIDSKKNCISTPLLDCYDINGELIEDRFNDFRNTINTFISNNGLEKIIEYHLDNNSILWLLDSDNKYRNYCDELKRKKEEETRLRKIQKKEQYERKKSKERILASSEYSGPAKNTIFDENEKNREIYKYVTYELVLKKNILELISYDDFKLVLDRDPKLNKKQIEMYLSEYKELYVENKINTIYNNLPEKYKLILDRIRVCDNENNIEIFTEVKNIIFDSRNEENDLLENIILTLDEYISVDKSDKTNIILFPSNEVFEENLNSVMNSEKFDSNTLKSLLHSLKVLESQSMESLKTKEKSFHEIKDSNSASFIIGPLKGYRYGAKKTKICLFQISVCEENKILLKELYNIENVPNILLVFGFGNVICENEKDLYIRTINTAKNNSEELLKIYDIFSTPFTDETLEYAKCIIESSDNSLKYMKKVNSK